MKWLLKENRTIKLIVVFLLLTLFLFEKIKQSNKQDDGFAHKASYSIGDDVVFSVIGVYEEMSKLSISSLTNDYQNTIEISPYKTFESTEVLLDGILEYSFNKFSSKGLKSGIYLINDTIPFVLKDDNQAVEIIVVFPYVNNLIKTKWKGNTVGSETYTYTNLYRSNFVDALTSEMKPFFNELSNKYSVKYISDVDLNNSGSLGGSKMLIFYGDLLYATSAMKNNVLGFINSGGHVLLASTYFFNNVIWMDDFDSSVIVLNKKAKESGVISKDRFGVSLWEVEHKYIYDYIGFSYAKGGFPLKNSGYEVVWDNSPLFKNLSMEKVPVNGYNFMGLDGEYVNNKFEFNLLENITVVTHASIPSEINGNVGMTGIFEVQLNERSGKILSLGTSQWFTDWNYGKSEDVRDITRDAISYLLND